MKIKTGYAQDCWGQTLKYQIVDETLSGKYVARHLIILTDVKGGRFVASGDLHLVDQPLMHNIKEEEV